MSLPANIADGPMDNPMPTDPEIIETACYSRLAEQFMIEKYEADEKFWAKYDVQPSWTFFGAHNGLFRKIPASHQEQCGSYDPRKRPWFVAASSGPKGEFQYTFIYLINLYDELICMNQRSSHLSSSVFYAAEQTLYWYWIALEV